MLVTKAIQGPAMHVQCDEAAVDACKKQLDMCWARPRFCGRVGSGKGLAAPRRCVGVATKGPAMQVRCEEAARRLQISFLRAGHARALLEGWGGKKACSRPMAM
jgi:hypothetical protein